MATSLTLSIANAFAAVTTASTVNLDANFQAVVTAFSGKATAISDVDTEVWPMHRSYLAGLTLSNDGGTPNTVLDVAVGLAADSTAVQIISLTSAFTGSTAGTFVAGTGNNKIDAGAIAASTWYHIYVIGKTTDKTAADILFSTSATAPTMPSGWNLKRRIGSFRTDGSSNILTFVQDGDYFRWKASVLDVNVTNPGSAAVTRTLTVPTGVNVWAFGNAYCETGGAGRGGLYLSDLAANDEAPSLTAAPASQVSAASPDAAAGFFIVRANTSAQIRSRNRVSDGSTILLLATLGWYDRRGKDA